jgi:uncharacterized Zn finger protein
MIWCPAEEYYTQKWCAKCGTFTTWIITRYAGGECLEQCLKCGTISEINNKVKNKEQTGETITV